MGKFILQLVLALSLLTTQAHAQNTDAQTRPIKPEEIIGTWGVVAFMPGSFGEKYPSSDYLTPSQIYGFYEDGHMRNLVSSENKQFNYNLEELEQRFGERPSTINYKFLADGIVAITVDEKKEIGTLWAPLLGLWGPLSKQNGKSHIASDLFKQLLDAKVSEVTSARI